MLKNQIGISTNIYDDPADMAALVRQLSTDFNIIEIEIERDVRRLIDDSPAQWAAQKRELIAMKKDRGLFYSMHGPYIGSEADISSSDEATRLIAVDYFSSIMDEASELHVPYITFHPGLLEEGPDGVADFSFEQLRKSVATLSTRAKDCGMQLLLENTGPDRPSYVVLSDSQHEELSREFGIGVTLDIVHFHSFYAYTAAEEYWDKLARILPLVKNAHFNDLDGRVHQHLPLGKGNFQFGQFMKRMVEQGYSGNFIVEERGGGFEPPEYVEATRRYIDTLAA
jgi:sugar phosphate isomerase/epimerase